MSLFGTEYPKFIGNPTTTRNEILLEHSVILKDEPQTDIYSSKSIKTGKRVFINAGRHWTFQVKVLLWKYADPSAKYAEIKAYETLDVEVYRHSDSYPIIDTYGNEGIFVLVSVDEDYFERVNYKDVLILTFLSKEKILSTTLISSPPSSIFLMNRTDETPQGSIGLIGTTNSRQLYEISNIPSSVGVVNVAKCFTNDSYNTIKEEFVNNYRAISLQTPIGDKIYFKNKMRDIFTGVMDFTFLVAFKRTTCGNENDYTLFNHYSTGRLMFVFVALGGTTNTIVSRGHFRAIIGNTTGLAPNYNFVNLVEADSTRAYDDGVWHVMAITFKQTLKTITFYSDIGEKVSNTNPDFNPTELTVTDRDMPCLAHWNHPNPWGDGVARDIAHFVYDKPKEDTSALGDFYFFGRTLTKAEINHYGELLSERVGITWTRSA